MDVGRGSHFLMRVQLMQDLWKLETQRESCSMLGMLVGGGSLKNRIEKNAADALFERRCTMGCYGSVSLWKLIDLLWWPKWQICGIWQGRFWCTWFVCWARWLQRSVKSRKKELQECSAEGGLNPPEVWCIGHQMVETLAPTE